MFWVVTNSYSLPAYPAISTSPSGRRCTSNLPSRILTVTIERRRSVVTLSLQSPWGGDLVPLDEIPRGNMFEHPLAPVVHVISLTESHYNYWGHAAKQTEGKTEPRWMLPAEIVCYSGKQ